MKWPSSAAACSSYRCGRSCYRASAGCRAEVYRHFLLSFTISGLIALTYSVFAVQYVALRALYPRLWVDTGGLRHQARDELKNLPRRLTVLQLLAGVIPLSGAILMIAV